MREQRGTLARRYAFQRAAGLIESTLEAGWDLEFPAGADDETQMAFDAVYDELEEIVRSLSRKARGTPIDATEVIQAFRDLD